MDYPSNILLDYEITKKDGVSYYLLGYEENGEEIAELGGFLATKGLKRYLLIYRISNWQRFKAKVFGFWVCLGMYKPVGKDTDYMNYYLFWHAPCRRFSVNYRRGKGNSILCSFCSPLVNKNPDITPEQLIKLSKEQDGSSIDFSVLCN